jgi:SNF2 family DNA or RNA helicase
MLSHDVLEHCYITYKTSIHIQGVKYRQALFIYSILLINTNINMTSKVIASKALQEAYAKAQKDIKGRLDGHYQHEGVKWMLERELCTDNGGIGKGGILADDMGLGKTMQAIATMRGNPTSTLIITIVGTVGQWRDALIDFGGLRPIIVNPSFKGILPQDADVVITTYSSFQKSTDMECFTHHPWGRIILDEGHKIRNSNSKGNIQISKLEAPIKWVLSGTPIQNSHKDILSLSNWIGYPSQDIEDIIDSILLRRTQEQQASINPRLALPGLDTQILRLDFETEEERSFYNKVEHYYMDNSKDGNEVLEASIRCRQAATHPQLILDTLSKNKKTKKKPRSKRARTTNSDDEDTQLPTTLPPSASKFSFLTKDLTRVHNTTKEKSLVFCTWTNEMKLLQTELKNMNISSLIYDGNVSRDNKEAVIYNFKNTSIPVLILQINCGNAGLNLQCATRIYITSPQWNPCVELQAIGRAYRKGQDNKVKCFRLTMKDTIEDRCTDIQMNKMDLIRDAMCDDSMISRLGTVTNITDITDNTNNNANIVPVDDSLPNNNPINTQDAQHCTVYDPTSDELDDLLKEIFGDVTTVSNITNTSPQNKRRNPYVFIDSDDEDMPVV